MQVLIRIYSKQIARSVWAFDTKLIAPERKSEVVVFSVKTLPKHNVNCVVEKLLYVYNAIALSGLQ